MKLRTFWFVRGGTGTPPGSATDSLNLLLPIPDLHKIHFNIVPGIESSPTRQVSTVNVTSLLLRIKRLYKYDRAKHVSPMGTQPTRKLEVLLM